jgi:hypothetical protein
MTTQFDGSILLVVVLCLARNELHHDTTATGGKATIVRSIKRISTRGATIICRLFFFHCSPPIDRYSSIGHRWFQVFLKKAWFRFWRRGGKEKPASANHAWTSRHLLQPNVHGGGLMWLGMSETYLGVGRNTVAVTVWHLAVTVQRCPPHLR